MHLIIRLSEFNHFLLFNFSGKIVHLVKERLLVKLLFAMFIIKFLHIKRATKLHFDVELHICRRTYLPAA